VLEFIIDGEALKNTSTTQHYSLSLIFGSLHFCKAGCFEGRATEICKQRRRRGIKEQTSRSFDRQGHEYNLINTSDKPVAYFITFHAAAEKHLSLSLSPSACIIFLASPSVIIERYALLFCFPLRGIISFQLPASRFIYYSAAH